MARIGDLKNKFMDDGGVLYFQTQDCGISFTKNVLGSAVNKIIADKEHQMIRQVAVRVVLLVTPIFQLFDGFANIVYPVVNICIFKLTGNEKFAITDEQKRCYLNYVICSFLGVIKLLPVLLHRPYLLSPKPAQVEIEVPESQKNCSDALSSRVPFADLHASFTDPAELISSKLESAVFEDPELMIDHQSRAKTELQEKNADELDNNWKLLDYFGHLRIINLDNDKDKLENIKRNLQAIGVRYEPSYRFRAILGKNLNEELWQRMDSNYKLLLDQKKLDKQHQAQMGCFYSHYLVIKEAKVNFDFAVDALNLLKRNAEKSGGAADQNLQKKLEEAKREVRKYSSVLILEDDNQFGRVIDPKNKQASLKGVGRVFRECMMQLPRDYDMFFMMALDLSNVAGNYSPLEKKQRIKPLFAGLDLNAYVVHSRFYDTLISHIEKKLFNSKRSLEPIDVEICKLMPFHKAYRATPDLAFQGGFVSGIVQESEVRPYVQRNGDEWHRVKEPDRSFVSKTA